MEMRILYIVEHKCISFYSRNLDSLKAISTKITKSNSQIQICSPISPTLFCIHIQKFQFPFLKINSKPTTNETNQKYVQNPESTTPQY